MDKAHKKEIYEALSREVKSITARHRMNCDTVRVDPLCQCSCGRGAREQRLTGLLESLHVALDLGHKKRNGSKRDDHHP